MSRPILLTDRTSIETDWACGKRRYWRSEFAGRGVVPVKEAEYYRQGRELHADYAALAVGGSAEAIVRRVLREALAITPTPTTLDLEHAWWHASMVAAFGAYILPKWLETYRPLMVEKELVLDRHPLHIACTEDLALIGHDPGPHAGEIIVIDYKTVRWLTQGWAAHWPYAVQMLINSKAIEEAVGAPVRCVYVVGVQKGQIRDGKLRHPYVYAYQAPDGAWSGAWKPSPWRLTPRWERLDSIGLPVLPDLDTAVRGVLDWVRGQGEAIAIDLHPMSAPVVSNDRLLNQLIRERTRREQEVDFVRDRMDGRSDLIETYFPSNFNACRPSIGDECPYLAACHNAEVGADPIGSGMYVPRTPHHDLEWLERESE